MYKKKNLKTGCVILYLIYLKNNVCLFECDKKCIEYIHSLRMSNVIFFLHWGAFSLSMVEVYMFQGQNMFVSVSVKWQHWCHHDNDIISIVLIWLALVGTRTYILAWTCLTQCGTFTHILPFTVLFFFFVFFSKCRYLNLKFNSNFQSLHHVIDSVPLTFDWWSGKKKNKLALNHLSQQCRSTVFLHFLLYVHFVLSRLAVQVRCYT